MAWNNVRNEPRREWIEQSLGLLGLVLLLVLNYLVQHYWWGVHTFWPAAAGPRDGGVGYLLGTIVFVLMLLVVFLTIVGGWYLAHEIGEIVCAMMKGIGFDPRPNPRENSYEYRKARGRI